MWLSIERREGERGKGARKQQHNNSSYSDSSNNNHAVAQFCLFISCYFQRCETEKEREREDGNSTMRASIQKQRSERKVVADGKQNISPVLSLSLSFPREEGERFVSAVTSYVCLCTISPLSLINKKGP